MKKLLTFCILLVLTACSELSAEQRKEAKDAIDALQRVDAAVHTGLMNYYSHGPLVNEAKVQGDQAVSILPEGELRECLQTASDSYVDAADVWRHLGSQEKEDFPTEIIDSGSRRGKNLLEKWKLKPEGDGSYFITERAREELWQIASQKRKRAEELLK